MAKGVHVTIVLFIFFVLFIACGGRVENPLTSGSATNIPSTNNVVVDLGDGLLVAENGIPQGTDTFTVALNMQPDYEITIGTIASLDTGEVTVSPNILTFTSDNWAVPQTVTVTGVDDALADGIQPVYIDLGRINCSACRGDSAGTVIVFNTDDESVSNFPAVLFTEPDDGIIDFPVDKSLFLTFNKSMDPATITTNVSNTACSGTVQVSSDGFASCVQMSSAPITTHSDMTFEIIPSAPLSLSTVYRVRVTVGVQDSIGNNMQMEYTMPAGFTTGAVADIIPPEIFIVQPDNGATDIFVSDPVAITFNESMNPATITTNGGAATCNSSLYAIQISTTNTFTTSDICEAVFAAPEVTNNDYTYIVQPVNNLLTNTVYYIRISNTAGARDAAGNLLVNGLTTSFTTAISADSLRPSVSTISPADGETGVPVNSDIAVLFSEQMEVSTVTVNTANTTCNAGIYAIEVSSDGFSNCVKMNSVIPSIANKKYTMTTTSMPSSGTNYQVRINDSVAQDRAGNGAVYYIQPGGFTVP